MGTISDQNPVPNPLTSFGELSVAEPSPIVQIIGQNGFTSKTQVISATTGTSTIENSEFKVTTGTNAGGFAAILTTRSLAYKPGQGATARFSARFSAGAVNSQQLAGLQSASDGFNFGFVDDEFGVLRRHGGNAIIQELQVTTAATGSESATVTVEGTGHTVPLTAGTVQHNAEEIAESLEAQVVNWDFSAVDDTVVANSVIAQPALGAFAFSSATAVAAWTEIAAGVTPTLDFTAQTDWNFNKIPSLDPTKGNVYQVSFQYLGYGGISFFVEDPATTELVLVHRIMYANSATEPSVTNPIFGLGWTAANLGNTTDIVIHGASAGGFIEGEVVATESARSLQNNVLAVGVTETPLLSIRNRNVKGTRRNLSEILPLVASASTDGNKGAIIELVLNGTLTDAVFQYVDKDNSITEIDTAATAITGGTSIAFIVPPDGFNNLDLKELDSVLLPGDTLTLTGRMPSGAAADILATMIWREDT